MATKTVTIQIREVGEKFATVAELRDARTHRKVAESREVPYGFVGAAVENARGIAEQRGWAVIESEEQ